MDIFKKLLLKTDNKPKSRQVYAVGTGTYVGEMFVYIKEDAENFHFLSIPKKRNRVVPKDKFEFAVTNKIMELVEDLPSPIYKLCHKQFFFNEKAGNVPKTTVDEA